MSSVVINNPTIFERFTLPELKSKEGDSKFKKAMQDGFIYLEIPESCGKLIEIGRAFANSFYKSAEVKGLKLDGFGGYHDRSQVNLQVESFYANRNDWEHLVSKSIFSEELKKLAEEMNKVGLEILRKILATLELPEEKWDTLTGDVASDKATTFFSFNHYRTELAHEGLGAHKDFGFVTVLFIDKLGLEGKVQNNWVNVPPLENHFIINFGRCLELITKQSGKINAIEHRVRMLTEDRASFGVFMDGKGELPVYCYDEKSKETSKLYESYSEYMALSFAEKYKK